MVLDPFVFILDSDADIGLPLEQRNPEVDMHEWQLSLFVVFLPHPVDQVFFQFCDIVFPLFWRLIPLDFNEEAPAAVIHEEGGLFAIIFGLKALELVVLGLGEVEGEEEVVVDGFEVVEVVKVDSLAEYDFIVFVLGFHVNKKIIT